MLSGQSTYTHSWREGPVKYNYKAFGPLVDGVNPATTYEETVIFRAPRAPAPRPPSQLTITRGNSPPQQFTLAPKAGSFSPWVTPMPPPMAAPRPRPQPMRPRPPSFMNQMTSELNRMGRQFFGNVTSRDVMMMMLLTDDDFDLGKLFGSSKKPKPAVTIPCLPTVRIIGNRTG